MCARAYVVCFSANAKDSGRAVVKERDLGSTRHQQVAWRDHGEACSRKHHCTELTEGWGRLGKLLLHPMLMLSEQDCLS